MKFNLRNLNKVIFYLIILVLISPILVDAKKESGKLVLTMIAFLIGLTNPIVELEEQNDSEDKENKS